MEQRRFQIWNARMALIPQGTVRNEFAKKHLPQFPGAEPKHQVARQLETALGMR
jgi:hypothetical protein